MNGFGRRGGRVPVRTAVVTFLAFLAVVGSGCDAVETVGSTEREIPSFTAPDQRTRACVNQWNQSFGTTREPALPRGETAYLSFDSPPAEGGGCKAYVAVPDVDLIGSDGGGFLFETDPSADPRRFETEPVLSGMIQEVIPAGLPWNATVPWNATLDYEWKAEPVENGAGGTILEARTVSRCIDAWNSPGVGLWSALGARDLNEEEGDRAKIGIDPLVPHSCEMTILDSGPEGPALLHFRSPSPEWDSTTVDPEWFLTKRSKAGGSADRNPNWNSVVTADLVFYPSQSLLREEAERLRRPGYGFDGDPIVNRFRNEFTDCGAIQLSGADPQAGITNVRTGGIDCGQAMEELETWMASFYGSIIAPDGWNCSELEDPAGSGREMTCQRQGQTISFFQTT